MPRNLRTVIGVLKFAVKVTYLTELRRCKNIMKNIKMYIRLITTTLKIPRGPTEGNLHNNMVRVILGVAAWIESAIKKIRC